MEVFEVKQMKLEKKLRIAVVGCLHGMLDQVYDQIMKDELQYMKPVDLVLICGDFQSLRTTHDFPYIHMPDKYKKLGDFHKYYSGKVKAPYLTLFVGGNHEASNVLDELFNGGWICPNIYYLGRSGVVTYKGIRIGGISGIFKDYDYHKGHFETFKKKPKDSDKTSIYHIREYDVMKLNLLKAPIDIMISHDWPLNIMKSQDYKRVVSIKGEDACQDLLNGTLGSPSSRYLFDLLKPKFWLAAHMHYYYRTEWSGENSIDSLKQNINKQQLDEYNQLFNEEKTTFIALDKIIKNRKWLDYIEVPTHDSESNFLTFDSEWLAINKAVSTYFPNRNQLYDFSAFFIKKKSYEKLKSQKSSSKQQNNMIKVSPKSEFMSDIQTYLSNYNEEFNSNPSKYNIKEIYELDEQKSYLSSFYFDKLEKCTDKDEFGSAGFSIPSMEEFEKNDVLFKNNDEISLDLD